MKALGFAMPAVIDMPQLSEGCHMSWRSCLTSLDLLSKEILGECVELFAY